MYLSKNKVPVVTIAVLIDWKRKKVETKQTVYFFGLLSMDKVIICIHYIFTYEYAIYDVVILIFLLFLVAELIW